MENNIIKEIEQKKHIKKYSLIELTNKNNTKVYLLNNKYIVKESDSITIKCENLFFNIYKGAKFEKIIYFSQKSNFIMYKYLKANCKLNQKSFNKFQRQIKKIMKNYVSTKFEGYGRIENLKVSWNEFLVSEIEEKDDAVQDKNKGLKVRNAIDKIKKYPFNKKIIHGDFGIYNMIYTQNKIKLIIDPQPVLGDYMFDVITFLFSKKDFFKIEYIYTLSREYHESVEKVISLMYVILYLRIGILKKYNTNDSDINKYNNIWNKIEKEEIKINNKKARCFE